MAILTINGQIGSGAREIGFLVAQRLGYEYVDVRILAEAARRLGTTVEAVTKKEQRVPTRKERFAAFLNNAMQSSAMAGAGGDPYFGAPLGLLIGQDYPQAAADPQSHHDQIEDEHYIAAIKSVIQGLAELDRVVIISRASNLILKGRPNVFHAGLVSTLESRAVVIAKREGVSVREAEVMANEHERARIAFFRRFFHAAVDNPSDYHLTLNTHWITQENAADILVHASNALR